MHKIEFHLSGVIDKLLLNSKISNGLYEFVVEKIKIKENGLLGITYSEKPRVGIGRLSNFDENYYGYILFLNSPNLIKVGLKISEDIIHIVEARNILFTDIFDEGEKVYFAGTIYDIDNQL